LTTAEIKTIMKKADGALCSESGVESIVSDQVVDYLADLADGDGNITHDRC
jgi:hypothetical protein